MPNKAIRLDNLPKEQLKAEIEDAFHNRGFSTELNEFTENKHSWLVKRKLFKTYLILERKPSRPLFVNVIADHVIYPVESTGLVVKYKRKKSSNRQSRPFLFYYLLWFLIPIIITIFLSFLNFIVSTDLPNILFWVFLTSIIVFFVGKFIWGKYSAKEIQKLDNDVFNLATAVLENIADRTLRATPTKKCWNCFSEVPSENEFCEQCGESQFNIDN